jgi:hypothetical protein
MKKLKAFALLLSCLLVCSATFAACGDGSKNGDSNSTSNGEITKPEIPAGVTLNDVTGYDDMTSAITKFYELFRNSLDTDQKSTISVYRKYQDFKDSLYRKSEYDENNNYTGEVAVKYNYFTYAEASLNSAYIQTGDEYKAVYNLAKHNIDYQKDIYSSETITNYESDFTSNYNVNINDGYAYKIASIDDEKDTLVSKDDLQSCLNRYNRKGISLMEYINDPQYASFTPNFSVGNRYYEIYNLINYECGKYEYVRELDEEEIDEVRGGTQINISDYDFKIKTNGKQYYIKYNYKLVKSSKGYNNYNNKDTEELECIIYFDSEADINTSDIKTTEITSDLTSNILYLDIDKNKVKTDILAGNNVTVSLAGGVSLDDFELENTNNSSNLIVYTDTGSLLAVYAGELSGNNIIYECNLNEYLDKNKASWTNIILKIDLSYFATYTDELTYYFTNVESITIPVTN